MKFGGTSLADASRIAAVAGIVRERMSRSPVVVVSALAGVTDLLANAARMARDGDRDGLEPVLAEVERRHRWAAGSVRDPVRRHDLTLALDALFDELRQLLRAVRILGEATPRSEDTLLAFGETLSARIVTTAFCDVGLPARAVDPREVMITDARHGAAEPDLDQVARRCNERVVPLLENGEVPVVGGFVGATLDGRTTTLGRGGSDTSAAILGAALRAEEIQIWTDVNGIMSADPRIVKRAFTRARVSFAEAAELAYYGAKVLHPSSIAPAVRRDIPVRVLSSLDPSAEGTVIVGESGPEEPALASVASRSGTAAVRVTSRRMRMDPGFVLRVLGAFDAEGIVPDLVVSSEVAVTLVVPAGSDLKRIVAALGGEFRVEPMEGRGIVCIVGAGLARDAAVRGEVLAALANLEPEMVALGGSATSVAAVVPDTRLPDVVRELHRRFFERGEAA